MVQTTRWISSALLLASLLIGLSHVAGLPPFEGLDEPAHYSYIQHIAKTGTLPHFGDKSGQDIEEVWGALTAGPGPRILSLRYRNLFTADAEIIQRARQTAKAARDSPPTGPGSARNHEVQHPPFYYALLTPAYLVSERWSLAGQLALLRGLSLVGQDGGLSFIGVQCHVSVWSDIHAIPLFRGLRQ